MLVTRVPRDSEWAFVKSFANQKLGQGKWIAILRGEWWFNHRLTPNYGDIMRLLRIEDISAAVNWNEERIRAEILEEEARMTAATEVTEEVTSPRRMGGLKTPLETVQTEVSWPLPGKDRDSGVCEIVELGAPPFEILGPELESPIESRNFPLLEMRCNRWESEFNPDISGEKLKKVRLKAISIMETRTSSQKMLKWLRELKKKYGTLPINDAWCKACEQAYRRLQTNEWDGLILANLKATRANDRDADFCLALLTRFNRDTTEEERELRLRYLPKRAVIEAYPTQKRERLWGADWDTWGFSDENLEPMCQRYEES
jgi:hypothetical protein